MKINLKINNMKNILYENLEKAFVTPKKVSPFYDDVKIPRKLKKKVKIYCGVYWKKFTNPQRLWYYLDKSNSKYKRYLIKTMCLYN